MLSDTTSVYQPIRAYISPTYPHREASYTWLYSHTVNPPRSEHSHIIWNVRLLIKRCVCQSQFRFTWRSGQRSKKHSDYNRSVNIFKTDKHKTHIRQSKPPNIGNHRDSPHAKMVQLIQSQVMKNRHTGECPPLQTCISINGVQVEVQS